MSDIKKAKRKSRPRVLVSYFCVRFRPEEMARLDQYIDGIEGDKKIKGKLIREALWKHLELLENQPNK